jgi:putative spermidine/putrescine transport system permease protein
MSRMSRDSTAGEVRHAHLLKITLARASRRRKARALLLVLPLAIFVLAIFLVPIATMLGRSIYSPDLAVILPRIAAALAPWDGAGAPPEHVWQALVDDMREASSEGTIGKAATLLNYEIPGARSLLMKAARDITVLDRPAAKTALLAADKRWGDPVLWGTLKRLTAQWTIAHYLTAFDWRITGYSTIMRQPEDQQIYGPLFLRTAKVGIIVTLLCLALGYPVAYLLANLPLRISNLLMVLVLLPFWTSLLVRTTAWIALLQKQGIINDVLVAVGLIADEDRFPMIYNQTGTLIAMTHVLLPFMILPLYSVMRSIPPTYMRAAASLGAEPFTAFRRVYVPQTLPGIGAGSLLVFILAIGSYITPALVGGDSGALISNLIAYHMQKSLNWDLAAALSTLLLAGVLVLYWLYDRVVGLDNMKLS